MEESKKKKFTLYIDEKDHDLWVRVAKAHRQSLNQFIQTVTEAYVNEWQKRENLHD